MVNFEHNIYFNGVPLPSFVIVKSISTAVLGEITNELLETNLGTRLKKTKLGSKRVTINFSVERKHYLSKFKEQQQLLEWLRGNDFKESKLVLPDNLNLHYNAICDNLDEFQYDDLEGISRIEFLICDPYRYGNLQEYDIDSLNGVVGNVFIYPTVRFTVTSQCNELKLSLVNSKYNNFIHLKHNFLTNDVVEIDMETKKVTVNGVVKMGILQLSSRFHMIDANLSDNTYTLDVGNANVSVILQEKYL